MLRTKFHIHLHKQFLKGYDVGKYNAVSTIKSHLVQGSNLTIRCLCSGTLGTKNKYHSLKTPRILHQLKFKQSVCDRDLYTNGIKFDSSKTLSKAGYTESQEQLISQMNIRMINENSFLSWCRNAYLSTVVGAAMVSEGSSILAQSAGAGAFVVGGMNLVWGTGCHVTNLIRLRHVTGMSGFTLFLNLLGSVVHCFLWLFFVICYIGFLDETKNSRPTQDRQQQTSDI